MRHLSPLWATTLLACFIPLLSGCGPSETLVTGKVVLLPGMKLAETDSVSLIFREEGEKGRAYFGDVSTKDLTFTAKVPKGKYKVEFKVQPYAGEKGSEGRAKAFEKLNKAFGEGSQLSYEVTGDSKDITVDLARNSVGK